MLTPVKEPLPHVRFAGLTYERFRELARDPTLSPHERSGFPDQYRAGMEERIIADFEAKLPALAGTSATVVDIGCGASPLAFALRARCTDRHHELVLIDSPEVLTHHEAATGIHRVAGRFPDIPGLAERWGEQCDAVIAYSVLQYSFIDAGAFAFLDAALELLRPGGRALVGDLPNASMRRRFLASDAGREHHRQYTGSAAPPAVASTASDDEMDDAAILGLAARARSAGFHAWVVPQDGRLPMANRREDLLVERP
jgi:hypothetical protein